VEFCEGQLAERCGSTVEVFCTLCGRIYEGHPAAIEGNRLIAEQKAKADRPAPPARSVPVGIDAIEASLAQADELDAQVY